MRDMLVCTAACSVTMRYVSGADESDCVREPCDAHLGVLMLCSDSVAAPLSLVRIRVGVK